MAWPGGEAPALGFGFTLRKAGYCERQVDYFSPRGGGGSAGSLWKVRIPLISVSNGPLPAGTRALIAPGLGAVVEEKNVGENDRPLCDEAEFALVALYD